jgi:hypothetical protein
MSIAVASSGWPAASPSSSSGSEPQARSVAMAESLQSVQGRGDVCNANQGSTRRNDWPERDLAIVFTALLGGLRADELISAKHRRHPPHRRRRSAARSRQGRQRPLNTVRQRASRRSRAIPTIVHQLLSAGTHALTGRQRDGRGRLGCRSDRARDRLRFGPAGRRTRRGPESERPVRPVLWSLHVWATTGFRRSVISQ